MILRSLDVDARAFAEATGWEIKPEGACRADVCVPLDIAAGFSARDAAERLGMAIVHDGEEGLWALGPASFGGRALATAVAPELVLSDSEGKEFRLSSLRGQKVILVAWSPY